MSIDDPARQSYAILIAGPTASGKTQLALALAKRLNAGIINADSMQVYAKFPVLTAQPTREEQGDIPHYLFGHIPPTQAYSVGQWQADVAKAVEPLIHAGRPIIIVGGTGLYFMSLTRGLATIPDVKPEIRDRLREDLARQGVSGLYDRLLTCDPELAQRIHSNDAQRIIRGLEVYVTTGRALSDWQKETTKPMLQLPCVELCLMPDRNWLYQRCNARFDLMLAAGAWEEVRRASEADIIGPTAAKILGLTELSAALRGELAPDAAIHQAKMMTRRYAKRQMTWFRNQMMSWNHLKETDYYNNVDNIFSFISKNLLTS